MSSLSYIEIIDEDEEPIASTSSATISKSTIISNEVVFDAENEVVFDYEEDIIELNSEDYSSINPELLAHANNGTLTKEILDEESFGDVLRLATHPKAKDIILSIYDTYGVMLKDGYELYPHQIEALKFMRGLEKKPYHGMRGGIVSLTMGLGKSLPAAILCLTTPPKNGIKRPSLIVASKTVSAEWMSSCIEKFFHSDVAARCLYFHKDHLGNRIDLMSPEYLEQNYDIIITTYDVLKSAMRYDKNILEDITVLGDEHTLMKGKVDYIIERTQVQCMHPVRRQYARGISSLYYIPFERVICDESQTFANPKTKIFESVMALYGHYKHCLSGTPIRNYDTDIFAQFRFLGYTKILRPIEWKRSGTSINISDKLCDTVIFTSNYEDVGIKLPDLTNVIQTQKFMNPQEKLLYDIIFTRTKTAYLEFIGGGSFHNVLTWFLRLRQCCIAPHILTMGDNKDDIQKLMVEHPDFSKWILDRSSTAGSKSSRIQNIVRLVMSFPSTEKVIIFSTFVSALELIRHALDANNIKSIQIDGSVKGPLRTAYLQSFRTDSSFRVLLLPYKVGSEGLNITEASKVILVEPWWNDAVHKQAIGRSFRMGQSKEVTAYYLNNNETVESRVLSICNSKNVMSDSYLGTTTKKVSATPDSSLMRQILGI